MKLSMKFSVVALCASAAVALLATPTFAQPEGAGAIELRDGVVVDLARGTVYLRNASGTLDARNAKSGAVNWSSEAKAKPLTARSNLVVAHREAEANGRLELVTYDAADGSALSEAVVSVPETINASLQDSARASFRAVARIDDSNDVHVSWQQTKTAKQVDQGYTPAPSEGKAPGFQSEVAEAAGTLSTSGAAQVSARTGSVFRQRNATELPVVQALRSYDGLPDVEGRKFLSRDGQHVLVSRYQREDPARPYTWSVYTVDGERLGGLRNEVSASPFLVVGNTLLTEARPSGRLRDGKMQMEPLRIFATDLATGQMTWSAPIAATEFAGPFAP